MAGQSNPDWAWDEIVLALDLYLRHAPAVPGKSHPDVVELSELLNQLPIHTDRPDQPKFRNVNGVYLKLQNLGRFDPARLGKGMPKGGALEKAVWDRYASNPEELSRVATAIRAQLATPDGIPLTAEEDEQGVEEGALLFRVHRRRERDRGLVERKKRSAQGQLACEVCGFDFHEIYGDLGAGFIEAHHTAPLASTGPTRTTTNDLALVCANCHRMLHRRRPFPSLSDLRGAMKRPAPAGPQPERPN